MTLMTLATLAKRFATSPPGESSICPPMALNLMILSPISTLFPHPIPAAAIVTMRGCEVIVEGADGLREVGFVGKDVAEVLGLRQSDQGNHYACR